MEFGMSSCDKPFRPLLISRKRYDPMPVLKGVFGLVGMLGFVGQILLYLTIMATAISEHPINIVNPLLHVQIILQMLVTPLFWILVAVTALGYFAAVGAEAMERQDH